VLLLIVGHLSCVIIRVKRVDDDDDEDHHHHHHHGSIFKVKKNQDKPKEERWIHSTLFKYTTQEKENEKEREKIQQVIIIFLCTAFILSFFFSLSFLLKDCSSVSKLLLLAFLSLSFSLVQFVLAFPLILSCSSHFIRRHAKVNKNSYSTPIVTTEAHHNFS